MKMKAVLGVIDATSDWIGKVYSYTIYIAIGVLTYEVAARYIFNAPTIWAHGISYRIFAVYYLLGGAYVLRHRAHINMDIIYNRFSLRTKAILDLVTVFFFFAFCGVLLWQGSQFAWKSLLMLEVDADPFHAPIYPVKLMLPLGAFLILLQGLAKFSRDLVTAITGRQA